MRLRTIFLSISRQPRGSLFSAYLSGSNNSQISRRVDQFRLSSGALSIANLSFHQFVSSIAHRMKRFTLFMLCVEKDSFEVSTCSKEILANRPMTPNLHAFSAFGASPEEQDLVPNTSGDRSSETFEQKNIVSKCPGSVSPGTLGLKGNLRSVKINGTKTKSIRSTTMAQIGLLEVSLGFSGRAFVYR